MRLSLARRVALVGVAVGALVLTGAPPALAADTGTISGRLTTNSGDGAADVPVQVYASRNYQSVGWTHTDSEGNWTIGGLNAGLYVVGFSPAERPEQYYRQKSIRAAADDVTVTAGATTTADDQLLPTGFLTGRITDTAGQPVVNLPLNGINFDSVPAQWATGRTDAEAGIGCSHCPADTRSASARSRAPTRPSTYRERSTETKPVGTG